MPEDNEDNVDKNKSDQSKWSRALASAEQGTSLLRDLIPPACWSMHAAFMEQGFSEAQAFRLTRDWMAYAFFNKELLGDDK